MGYYTRYTLRCDDPNLLAEVIGSNENLPFEEDGTPFDECKWYEHDDDMIEISKQYPENLFILEGEGEEGGDLWRTYYKNGKLQHAQAEITFADFDPKKLETKKAR